MAINLSKGQTINLDKDVNDLSKICIGLGWDVKKKNAEGGFFKKLFAAPEDDFDLDAFAILLGENGKIMNFGNKLVGSDVIFFNNLHHPSGHIWHTGDNLTGEGEGDDEQIMVNLRDIGQHYHRIIFAVNIYQGTQRGQHFGQVENAFIRAVDGRNNEMLRFNLSDDSTYNNMRTVVFAEVYRKDGGWKFRALGDPSETDQLGQTLQAYM
jgi:tellurium resistance protein TerD